MPRLDVCPFFCLVMSQCCMDVCNVMYSGREQDTGNMLILGLKVLALQRIHPATQPSADGMKVYNEI